MGQAWRGAGPRDRPLHRLTHADGPLSPHGPRATLPKPGSLGPHSPVRPVAGVAPGGWAVRVRLVLATALLAGVALFPVPVGAASQVSAGGFQAATRAPRTATRAFQTAPPGETEAERIVRETEQAVRASEQARLRTSLAPLSPAQR